MKMGCACSGERNRSAEPVEARLATSRHIREAPFDFHQRLALVAQGYGFVFVVTRVTLNFTQVLTATTQKVRP